MKEDKVVKFWRSLNYPSLEDLLTYMKDDTNMDDLIYIFDKLTLKKVRKHKKEKVEEISPTKVTISYEPIIIDL